jgi:hypothetical protein
VKLFIYYKFLPLEQPELKARVDTMQSMLQNRFRALDPQLLRRPNPDEHGQVTWMEIYELTADDLEGFKLALEQAVLAAQLPQPRRSELFVHC